MNLTTTDILRTGLGLEGAVLDPSVYITQDTDNDVYLETANDATEIESVSASVQQLSTNLERIENTETTLESIHSVLSTSVRNGLVNHATHAVSYVTLESIAMEYGLPAHVLATGLEDGENNPEQASASMVEKIKGLLTNLKEAGSEILDKIASGIEVIRKDIGKIAGRIKQRINTLKSNIDKTNKGGVPVKISSSSLLGNTSNGEVSGKTFLPALKNSVNMVTAVTNASISSDVLDNFIKMMSAVATGKGKVDPKSANGFMSHILKLCKNKADSKNGYDYFVSDPLLNGKCIQVKRPNGEAVKSLIEKCKEKAKKVLELFKRKGNGESVTTEDILNSISLENVSDGKDELSAAGVVGDILVLLILLAIYIPMGSGSIIVGIGALMASELAFGILMLACGLIIVGCAITLIVQMIAFYIKTAYRAVKGSLEGLDIASLEANGDDTTDVELKERTITDAEIELICNLSSTTSLVNVSSKQTKTTSVVSLSAQEITAVCDNINYLCDSVINFVGKTKERKSLITEFKSTAKGLDKVGKQITRKASAHMRHIVNFEVDYVRSISGFIRTAMSYAEASNNAKAAELTA